MSELAPEDQPTDPRYPDTVVTAPDPQEPGSTFLLTAKVREALTNRPIDDDELEEFDDELNDDNVDEDQMRVLLHRWVTIR